MIFLFPKLKTAIKETIFEAVSSIQQAVTQKLEETPEEALSRAFVCYMSDGNVAPKRAQTALSDTNKQKNSVAFSPQADYTGRAAAAGRRSQC
jgi:hypothetical protein